MNWAKIASDFNLISVGINNIATLLLIIHIMSNGALYKKQT